MGGGCASLWGSSAAVAMRRTQSNRRKHLGPRMNTKQRLIISRTGGVNEHMRNRDGGSADLLSVRERQRRRSRSPRRGLAVAVVGELPVRGLPPHRCPASRRPPPEKQRRMTSARSSSSISPGFRSLVQRAQRVGSVRLCREESGDKGTWRNTANHRKNSHHLNATPRHQNGRKRTSASPIGFAPSTAAAAVRARFTLTTPMRFQSTAPLFNFRVAPMRTQTS